MAYTTRTDSIIIKATLTDKGRKLLSRGKFKVAKFTLADDEVDYRLYNAAYADDEDYVPALKNTLLFEASGDSSHGLQYGLASYDAGILYQDDEDLAELETTNPHARVEYLPSLVLNKKISYIPTTRNNRYYVSINDETTKILNDNLNNFKFLEVNDFDKVKIVVESGLALKEAVGELAGTDSPKASMQPTVVNREKYLVKRFLIDQDYMVEADNRFISNLVGIQDTSKFENINHNDAVINFSTALNPTPAISLQSSFDYYATYLLSGIPNLMWAYEINSEWTLDEKGFIARAGQKHSSLRGPRGSVVAFNVMTDNKMKVNSTGERDSRFTEFGTVDNILFSEMPTRKFDYIDTTIYIVGVTTNSGLQIPLRIIRYAGT